MLYTYDVTFRVSFEAKNEDEADEIASFVSVVPEVNTTGVPVRIVEDDTGFKYEKA